jgi:hypothetical protein
MFCFSFWNDTDASNPDTIAIPRPFKTDCTLTMKTIGFNHGLGKKVSGVTTRNKKLTWKIDEDATATLAPASVMHFVRKIRFTAPGYGIWTPWPPWMPFERPERRNSKMGLDPLTTFLRTSLKRRRAEVGPTS